MGCAQGTVVGTVARRESDAHQRTRGTDAVSTQRAGQQQQASDNALSDAALSGMLEGKIFQTAPKRTGGHG